jgi:hypothetical protein
MGAPAGGWGALFIGPVDYTNSRLERFVRKIHLGHFGICLVLTFVFSHSVNAQNIDVRPRLVAFPSQMIGTTSPALLVTVNNNQTGTLTISGIQTSLPYKQTSNCGATLAPNQTCTISVTFSPTAVKYYSSSLSVTDSATNSPQVISLTGNGVASSLSYAPFGGLYFYNQIAATASTPQAVTLNNSLSTTLTFTSMSTSADYPFTTNCGGTLAAGASCTVQISFDPTTVGKHLANLTVGYNAAGSPLAVALQGTGVAGSPGAAVSITPPSPCILPSESLQFNAIVTGETNTAVSWYVDNVLNGNSTVGRITTSGLYTAPPFTGTHRIKGISQASSSVSGASAINVTNAPVFEIYPFVSSIPTGGHQTFQAQVCLVPDTRPVTFTVDNIAGGNGTVGTVTSSGVYTAPAVAGKHTVRVTDSTLNKTSGAVVTAFSSITADFNSRANTTATIPAGMLGYGRGEALRGTSDRELLTQAGLTETRLSSLASIVYATQTPNWTKIDPMIAALQSTGQHAILQLNQSPPWLQPASGPCAGNAFAAPTNISEWVQIATAYVAHLDSKFPGVVQDYEIWNEPNATGMCTPADHLSTYLSIYAAAAPAMKTQAAQDGKTIRIGGPVLSGFSQYWLSAFLTNSSTAPYVDFVSYHQYIYGAGQLQAQWNSYAGVPSLYEATQDPSTGALANYKKVLAQVALGKQPSGANTPVYVSEFNTNWAFFKDCCRNDSTYAPLWNSLYVIDMLDSVYNGASRVPDKLTYFAGSAYPWFCMIGVRDANMDCLYSAGATPVPYPQYYAYQLFASPSYLGLSAGGYMAKSISTPTGGGGLATTAFYTAAQDAIVITNPTATAYSQVTVTFANPGFASTQGTLYTVVNGAQIDSSTISFSSSGANRTTTIDVPAYSVQGISLK